MDRRCARGLLVLAIVLAAADDAGAERPHRVRPQSPAERASELTGEGYELQRQGRLNDAIQLYKEALRQDPQPKRYRNLGLPLEQAGRLAEALAAFWQFQRDGSGEPAEDQKDVAARVERILPRLGAVVVTLAPLSADEGAARVVLLQAGGDRPRCVPDAAGRASALPGRGAGQRYLCEPGSVHADLYVGDEKVASREVTAGAHVEARIDFSVRGPVRIQGNRSRATLVLDRQPLQPAPSRLPLTLTLTLGTHMLSASAGRDRVEQRFRVPEDRGAAGPNVVDLRFPPSRKWIFWAAGTAAVLLGTGVLLGVLLQSAPPAGADVVLPRPGAG